ncbi:hypothetical protein ACFVYE_18720 [Streptomyces sp. NPDC058239]|uniref:hypothetical protein n=1 Tax=Streptomyces sp. NPDC058239 TaxID=3346395 RepID=UPI0036E854E4
MIDEAATWQRLAALLPRDDALQVMDAGNIGEQEGGLSQLVSLLVRQQVVIEETMRAELAVLAEAWGLWPSPLGPGIVQCQGDGCDSLLRLVEHDGDAPMTGPTVGLAPELLLVPWIACTESGHLLTRAHTRGTWGDLSCLPEHYVILDPDRSTAIDLFPPDAGWDALSALRRLSDPAPEVR